MSEYRVAGRYAKSLLDLAREQKITDAVCGDMKSLLQALKANAPLGNVLKSPIIHGDKKMAILKQLFEKGMHKLSISFFEIIVRKKREAYLEAIANAYVSQYNVLNKISTATVKTAVELDASIKDQVRQYLEKESGKKVELKVFVDPALIGGLMIQMEDRLYDASIAGKLHQAKQNLVNTYISK